MKGFHIIQAKLKWLVFFSCRVSISSIFACFSSFVFPASSIVWLPVPDLNIWTIYKVFLSCFHWATDQRLLWGGRRLWIKLGRCKTSHTTHSNMDACEVRVCCVSFISWCEVEAKDTVSRSEWGWGRRSTAAMSHSFSSRFHIRPNLTWRGRDQ